MSSWSVGPGLLCHYKHLITPSILGSKSDCLDVKTYCHSKQWFTITKRSDINLLKTHKQFDWLPQACLLWSRRLCFMMTSSNGNIFRVTWPFVRGILRSPVKSPHKGQWRGALMFSLICAWINGWVNNGEAGDLRRHRVHCNIIVMLWSILKRN